MLRVAGAVLRVLHVVRDDGDGLLDVLLQLVAAGEILEARRLRAELFGHFFRVLGVEFHVLIAGGEELHLLDVLGRDVESSNGGNTEEMGHHESLGRHVGSFLEQILPNGGRGNVTQTPIRRQLF